MRDNLKAPFPYFGGKSKIAPFVWDVMGDVRNYIEPFAGSLAVLLARPEGFKGPETVNDWSCHLANAWRCLQKAPEEMAYLCVGVVSEVDTESQHAWLIRNADRLRIELGDPDYFDLKAGAYYIKGACEWIGSGWASGEGPWGWSKETGWIKSGGVNRQIPHVGDQGKGVNRKIPHVGNQGTGVNRQIPHVGNQGTGQYQQRVDWLIDWFSALQDRLCSVRIACGDWKRVACSSSCTTKHGLTGVFLDPPYDTTEYVYGKETSCVSKEVREWCIKEAFNPLFKIVLAGRGAEHDELLNYGYKKEVWSTNRGYSKDDKMEEAKTETVWYKSQAEKEGVLL